MFQHVNNYYIFIFTNKIFKYITMFDNPTPPLRAAPFGNWLFYSTVTPEVDRLRPSFSDTPVPRPPPPPAPLQIRTDFSSEIEMGNDKEEKDVSTPRTPSISVLEQPPEPTSRASTFIPRSTSIFRPTKINIHDMADEPKFLGIKRDTLRRFFLVIFAFPSVLILDALNVKMKRAMLTVGLFNVSIYLWPVVLVAFFLQHVHLIFYLHLTYPSLFHSTIPPS